MIVVATDDFELYHDLVQELRDRGVTFTTVRPGEPLPGEAGTVITAEDDSKPDDVDVVVADPAHVRDAVEEALESVRDPSGQRIVGVDPGTNPGIAVLAGNEIVAAFQVPLDQAARTIRNEVEGSPDAIVRIGDGARIRGSTLIDDLPDVQIELVDETGTTPHLGQGARGMGDVLAAVNIAQRDGDVIETRAVEPTAGEIQTIKTASRERSAENRAITAALARRVARGELTIDEALAEHRDR